MKLFQWLKKIFLRLSARRNRIYYINGPEVLPEPLGQEEEGKLLDHLEEDDSLRRILVERNLRLVVFIAKRFEGSGGVSIEELISIGTVGLMKAINTFRPDKNIKLATYASRCIENEILMFLRKDNTRRREISIDEPLKVDWDGNELLLSDVLGSDADIVGQSMEEREERQLIRKRISDLGPREREIIELRYGLRNGRELTQKEVADKLGISQSYISRLEKKILLELREELRCLL